LETAPQVIYFPVRETTVKFLSHLMVPESMETSARF